MLWLKTYIKMDYENSFEGHFLIFKGTAKFIAEAIFFTSAEIDNAFTAEFIEETHKEDIFASLIDLNRLIFSVVETNNFDARAIELGANLRFSFFETYSLLRSFVEFVPSSDTLLILIKVGRYFEMTEDEIEKTIDWAFNFTNSTLQEFRLARQ